MINGKQHVLVTTDLSGESIRAFSAAADLARATGGQVTVLYVLPKMDHSATGSGFVPPVALPTDAELLALALQDLQPLRTHFEGVAVLFEALVGVDVATEVCRFAEQHGVDYIVLATHGRTGLRRIIMGSVAEQILRRSTRPVLVVPVR